jgi:hypothetical protein
MFNCLHGDQIIQEEFDLNEIEDKNSDEETNMEADLAEEKTDPRNQESKPWWKVW